VHFQPCPLLRAWTRRHGLPPLTAELGQQPAAKLLNLGPLKALVWYDQPAAAAAWNRQAGQWDELATLDVVINERSPPEDDAETVLGGFQQNRKESNSRANAALRSRNKRRRALPACLTATSWVFCFGKSEDAEAFAERFGGESLPVTQ
jgi:hypothetical protein